MIVIRFFEWLCYMGETELSSSFSLPFLSPRGDFDTINLDGRGAFHASAGAELLPFFSSFCFGLYSMTGGSKSSLPYVDVLHYFDAVMVDVDVDGYEISQE